MTTMRAVRFHEYGPPATLVIDEVDRPRAGAGQVVVRVRAAGVNPIDWKVRSGMLKDYMPVELPHTGGLDLAGVIEEVGPGVSGFAKGQAVFGRGSGAYAEYATADTATLALKPDGLSFEDAASIPIGAATAWAALFTSADLLAGQRILIHGAAGGVGGWAVQMARWKGADVIGTASTANVEFVRSLGAGEVIDYTTTRFEDVVKDVDVVFNTVGGDLNDRSWPVLRKGGVLLDITGQPSEDTARQHGVRTVPVQSNPSNEVLTTLATLIESGTVRPVITTIFPLEELEQAQTLSETGHGRGRIVVSVTG